MADSESRVGIIQMTNGSLPILDLNSIVVSLHHESSSQLFRRIPIHASLFTIERNQYPLKFGIVFDLEEATIVDTTKPDRTLMIDLLLKLLSSAR